MVEGVLVVDEQGRLQLVNDAARRMLKLEQRGRSTAPYVEAIRHPGIVEHIGRALAGEQTEGLELSVTRDTHPHAGRARRAGGRRRPRRGAGAARHHRPAKRRSDPPRLRRQRLARAAHAADRDQGLRRGAARRPRRRRGAASGSSTSSIATRRAWSGWSRTCCGWRGSTPARRPSSSRRATSPALLRGVVDDFEPLAAREAADVSTSAVAADARDAGRPMPPSCTTSLRNLVENAVNYTPDGGAIDVARRRRATAASS